MPIIGHHEVEEARARNLVAAEGRAEHALQLPAELVGDVARRGAEHRREQHRRVGRVIALPGALRALEPHPGAEVRLAATATQGSGSSAKRRPQFGDRIAHVLDRRAEGEPRHLGAGHRVRGDHLVGAGVNQLALGLLDRRAGDHANLARELAGGERDEDVLGVGVHARDHGVGTFDPGVQQDLVVRGLRLDVGDPIVLGRLAVVGVLIDHDDLGVAGAEITCDLAAYASIPADDEVVCVGIDHLLNAALVQEAAELPGDEELGNCRQAVEERTYPEQLEDREDHAPAGVGGGGKRADGGDLVERPGQAEGDRGVLEQRERDRAR